MKKKITIVVADGFVASVFADEELEVEIVDFDGTMNEDEDTELGNYVDELRKTKKEMVC